MSQVSTIEPRQRSVTIDMATRYGMEAAAFEATVRATCMSGQNVSREHFAAFLLVAKEYGLNPLTKEIYAFPAKGGGIQPIVSIDGWMRMINDHPAFNGLDFQDTVSEDGQLVAVTCCIYRKDRTRPISVIEYMAECKRSTDVWRQWPRRMLRHKAAIQCARYAFGFSGIMEPDEYDRMVDVTPKSTMAQRLPGAGSAGFSSAKVEEEIATITHQEAPHQHVERDTQGVEHDPDTGEVNETIGQTTESREAGQQPLLMDLPAEATETELQVEETAAPISNLSDPDAGTDGSDGREERESRPTPESLSSNDREILQLFVDSLDGERSGAGIMAVKRNFWGANPPAEGSALAAATNAIFEAHKRRVKGEIAIAECDRLCREARQ